MRNSDNGGSPAIRLGTGVEIDIPRDLPASQTTYAPFDSTFPAYYKQSGRVYLQGAMKRATGDMIAANGADLLICTLPLGYRPATIRRFTGYAGVKQTGFMKVEATGDITLYSLSTAITWIDLSQIQFQAVG
jgi:hypothetical protein